MSSTGASRVARADGPRATSALGRVGAALVVSMLSGCAGAIVPLPPRGALEVEPGQGILVLETVSNSHIELLRAAGPAGSFAYPTLEDLPAGRHIHLIALSEGEYRWNRIELPGVTYRGRSYPVRWDLENDEEWRFSIRAGHVNYPGALILTRSSRNYLSYRLVNRSGELLDRLREISPDLLDRFPIRYGGPGRDDFLAFYHANLRASPPAGSPAEEADRGGPGGP